ncbi:FAD-dependent oxidoreductase [Nocardioides sp. WS12]|uniref:NAD(P)/FAD-dependent oxidoreductase n=1 Tax=Nocardioides sp. WS12 TaxID=2486272 RepID=UPI00191C9616|nr:FAD-dependent oxidoreductase [Nocardioides sp. WS12]
MSLRKVVIVGASAAGLAAAETVRREGFEGSLVMIGDESHLPYDRPPLSKQILKREWTSDRLALRARPDVDALAADWRLGVPALGLDLVDRSVVLGDGSKAHFDGLIVATGVRPRLFPTASAVRGAHVLRTLDDAAAIATRLAPGGNLVVIGAGFLGCEVAASARAVGANVTLLEPAPVPLAQVFGERVGAMIADLHRDHGVDVRLGIGVSELVVDGECVTGVRLADGSVVDADDVVSCIGSLPNTEWLEGSGLTVDNGVVCDEFLMAAPGVYAAGDVARWHHPRLGKSTRIEHRTNAAEQGMAAARNLLANGVPTAYSPVPYFWSDQYDLKLQAYGSLAGHEEMLVVEGDLAEWSFVAVYRTADRITGVVSVGMPVKRILPWRAAIGSDMSWHDAVERVQAGSI